MADAIKIEDFAEYLTDLCTKEAMNAEETLDEIVTKRAAEIKKKLNSRSPKDTGGYGKGWRVKTAMRNHEKVKIIYNAAKPWLTYILEYGNAHQGAQPHIRPVLEEEMDEIIEELLGRL